MHSLCIYIVIYYNAFIPLALSLKYDIAIGLLLKFLIPSQTAFELFSRVIKNIFSKCNPNNLCKI